MFDIGTVPELGGGVLRFAGFELDQQRAELRGPDREPIRLRPKPFAMLKMLAANAGRIVSKQELMEAVWPNIHVGEDSLFQCIREIRAALGDDERRLIKVVSGRGYLFEAEVTGEPFRFAVRTEPAPATGEARTSDGQEMPAGPAKGRLFPFGFRGRAAVAAVAGLCAVVGLAVAAPILVPDLIFARKLPAIAVMSIVATGNDPSMAANVTDRLTDGLAGIDNIRVMAQRGGVSKSLMRADFVVSGTLQKGARAWIAEARMTDAATGEVRWSTSVSVDAEAGDPALQQSRLAAGLGHQLAVRINALIHSGGRETDADPGLPAGDAKVVIEQATAAINQTTRERFAAAQTMLENALASAPDNVDLQVALAGLQTRGIQMVWYDPAEGEAAESEARSLLERALKAEPSYIPVLEAYCRFLTATNNFVESLVACARVLSFDPWNGSALYQLGLTQLLLGRFDDALASFREANRFDTPEVSRWTWLLGAGWANLMLGHDEEASRWLERSIAITPASGRSYLLLAAAYQHLGRTDEAKAALAKALALRPGSTALNVGPPTKNASPVFLETGKRIIRTMVEVGLPEG